jgi:Lipocalin-like domain
MRRNAFMALALLVILPIVSETTRSDEPKKQEPPRDKLVGTWRLASAKYNAKEIKFREGTTMIKHITPTHFMWVTYDQDGNVSRTAGGTYTLKGDDYVENPEYGLGADFEIIKGKAQTFKCKVDGSKWHNDGELSNGLTIAEIWERVERK